VRERLGRCTDRTVGKHAVTTIFAPRSHTHHQPGVVQLAVLLKGPHAPLQRQPVRFVQVVDGPQVPQLQQARKRLTAPAGGRAAPSSARQRGVRQRSGWRTARTIRLVGAPPVALDHGHLQQVDSEVVQDAVHGVFVRRLVVS